jgi:hypothetical protein
MAVCKEGWSTSSHLKEASSWHVWTMACRRMLCKNTTPMLSMLCLLLCIMCHNLFRVSQYAAALIVVPRGRNSTNKIHCLSQNKVHMIFLVDIMFGSPLLWTGHIKPCALLRQSASVWVLLTSKCRLRDVKFDSNK